MTRAKWWSTVSVLTAAALLMPAFLRLRHERRVAAIWQKLERSPEPAVFDPQVTATLPVAARRYLLHAIAPGTPLARSVRLSMHGGIRLAPGSDPLRLQAEQILTPFDGFVWRAYAARGPMRIRGFDRYANGEGEMRWWLWGLFPVMTTTGGDVSRSAAGRLAMESVLMPSALCPPRDIRWEEIDEITARIHVAVGPEAVATTLEIAPDGRPRRISAMRWNPDAGTGTAGYSRFDVDQFDNEAEFDGYTIPTRFRAGWRLGDPDEFPFFDAVIDSASFR